MLTSSRLLCPGPPRPTLDRTYVAALGFANATGRLGWAVGSDYVGRKRTYYLFGIAAPIMAAAPTLAHMAAEGGAAGSTLPLSAFYAGSLLAISFYGGVFSILPAYISDIWGQKYAGSIHGGLLTAWASSAVVGPVGLSTLRTRSEKAAIAELVKECGEDEFQATFGASPSDDVSALVEAKTITIPKLVEIAPVGTVDPTPFLYDSTCMAAAGLLGVAAVANHALRPPTNLAQLLVEHEGTAALQSTQGCTGAPPTMERTEEEVGDRRVRK